MTVAFEHPSIREAIARSGVKSFSMTVNDVPSVFIGWSEREVLLLNPEYAWLSTDVRFLRLPQPIDVLRQEIDNSSPSVPPSKEVEVLCTRLGQWRWAVGELRDALNRGESKEFLVRMMELQRFAAKYWPGWYEKALSDLLDSAKGGTSVSELLPHLISNAISVAVLEAASPLFAWSESGLKGQRIVSLEDALCYAEQEVGEAKTISELAVSDPWWNDMEIDLAATETNLNIVRQASGDSELVLGDKLLVLRECIREIRKIEGPSGSLSCEKIRRVYASVTTLQETFLDLEELREHTRKMVWLSLGIQH